MSIRKNGYVRYKSVQSINQPIKDLLYKKIVNNRSWVSFWFNNFVTTQKKEEKKKYERACE
jgi:hypothetical protein